MQEIVLRFPPLSGGPDQGINDGGLETFQGDIPYYIARECAQNSIDAAHDKHKPVILEFSLLSIPIDSLPCLTDFKDVFNACKEYQHKDDKAVEFFNTAITKISTDRISTLKISDYETTGLTGGDFEGRWYGLVQSRGTSVDKSPGSGGSYGIGKNSHLAASHFRTVYYTTKTETDFAFQGVTLLTTHLGTDGKKTQGSGYIGYDYDVQNEVFRSVRNICDIPALFLSKHIGTSIFIPCYRDEEDWQNNLILAAVDNFWPAILFRKIVFKIADHVIDDSNVHKYISDNSDANGFAAGRYFNAFKNGIKFETELNPLGKVRLHLIVDQERRPKPIAVVRQNGMIIEYFGNFSSRKPFSGIFICDNEEGNIILRKMEPPRHNKLDPTLIKGGKKIISDIRAWIRECIEKLMPLPDSGSFTLAERFLPDETNEDEDQFDTEGNNESPEGFVPKPSSVEVHPPKVILQPIVAATDKNGEEFVEGTETTGEIAGGGENGDTVNPIGGDGKNTGGDVNRTGGETNTKAENRRSAKLKFRSFHNKNDGSYTVIIRADQPYNGNISPMAIGDDGAYEEVRILEAYKGDDKISILENGKYISVSVSPEQPERLKLFLNRKESIALRYAYENN